MRTALPSRTPSSAAHGFQHDRGRRQAREHDPRIRRNRGRRAHSHRAGGDQSIDSGFVAVIHDYRVPCGEQTPGHRAAHSADADEAERLEIARSVLAHGEFPPVCGETSTRAMPSSPACALG
jgi:hypothetical protein